MQIFGMLFKVILGLVFIVMALVIALETAVPTFQSWQEMKIWQRSTAQLIELQPADDTTVVLYRYTLNNLEYRNDRVYVAPFTDNIGEYHQNIYQQLLEIKQTGQLLNIWYDPYHPQNSVIDREIRWELFAINIVFCFIIASLGVFLFKNSIQRQYKKNVLGTTAVPQRRRQWHRVQQQKNQQDALLNDIERWRQNKHWQSNIIRSDAKTGLIAIWLFAIIWMAVSLPLIMEIDKALIQQNYVALLAFIFPIIGFFLIIKAWKMTREWLKYGVIELEMDPFPGSIGGHVGGSFSLKNVKKYRANYTIELQCIHSVRLGSGKNRRQRESIEWAEKGEARVELTGNGVKLTFRFNVPDNLPGASDNDQSDYYFWQLKLSSDSMTPNLERNYKIPVFKTQQQSQFIQHDISAQATANEERKIKENFVAINSGNFDETALKRSLIFKDKGDKQILYFPMFRNKLLSAVALLFAGGFSFAAYSISHDFNGSIDTLKIGMFISLLSLLQ